MARIPATAVLRNQHREAQALFALFDGTAEADIRRKMAAEMVKKLSIHAAIEELVFYPAVRDRVPGGHVLVERSLAEHHEVKELLTRLDRAVAGHGDIGECMSRLRTSVEDHVVEEETDVFPAVDRAMTTAELADLGQRLAAEQPGAPTRPHPRAPDTPPANRLADAAAAALDRARDAVSRH